jgi:hypothetical protein
MLHLILEIGDRFLNMRDTDRERSVTRLPGKLPEGVKVSCAQAEDPPLISCIALATDIVVGKEVANAHDLQLHRCRAASFHFASRSHPRRPGIAP